VALAEMRGLMLENGVKTVVIEKLDRLARDLMIQETIICDFRKNQIQLLSTAEPDLCSDEPSRKFFRQIMGAVAEFDRAMLTARMQSGKNRILATGKKCGGRLHYGERSPEERAVIDMILACREARMNYSQIALKLAAAGFKTRAGTSFSPTQIIRILRREKSCLPSSQSLPSSESDSSSPTTKDGVDSVS
jgi:DNA invertase Pin-like site-specific DNA recombinase